MKPLTIRWRLFLLVLLVVIPALLVQLFGAWNDLQQDISDRKSEISRLVIHAQQDFMAVVTQMQSEFLALSQTNELRSSTDCNLVYNDLRFAYERLSPDVSNLLLSDPQGHVFCFINPAESQGNLAGQPEFQAALENLGLSLGTFSPNPTSGTPVIRIAYPVISSDGNVQSVIIAILESNWLINWKNETDLPPDTALTLFSPDGTLLYRSLNGVESKPDLANTHHAAWLALIQNHQNILEAPDLDGVLRLNALVPLTFGSQTPAFLHLGYPVAGLYTHAHQSLWWKLLLLGLIMAAALLIAWWGSEVFFLKPFGKLMRAVEQVQAGDLGVHITGVGGVAELDQLSSSFDRMTSALQQREADRQVSEARFRAIFETSAVGVGVMSLDRKLLDANASLCKMFGRTREELIGNSPFIVIHPEDYPQSTQEYLDLLAGDQSYYTSERRYVRKNGEVFWAHVTQSVVRDANGHSLYLVGMVIDINDERRMLAELQESEAHFRAVFDNAAVGVALMSLDHKVVQINQTAMRLTGFGADEMKGVDPVFMSFEEDRHIDAELYKELVEGKRDQYTVEKRYYKKNKTLFWGRVNFSAVCGADGKPKHIIGMIEDITEEKRAAERLAQQEQEYRRILEQRIAERTEELSHANTLLQQKAAQEAVVAERTRLARDLHDAVTQTLFSATLIADVLPQLWEINIAEGQKRLAELHQLTRGALAEMRTLLVELRPNALLEVPLPSLLRQLAEAITGRSRVDVQLSLDGDRSLPPDVQVALYRIAQEALNNVVKHARATQAMLTLRLGEQVRLTITDNGTGFDPAAVTADHLGLKIMRERAESIGAQLKVYSEPGDGAQISVLWEGTL